MKICYTAPTLATLLHVGEVSAAIFSPLAEAVASRVGLRLAQAVARGDLGKIGALQGEATNALDLASEHEIWKFIRTWLPGSVLLVAVHRTENFDGAEREIRVCDACVESVA